MHAAIVGRFIMQPVSPINRLDEFTNLDATCCGSVRLAQALPNFHPSIV